MPRSFDSPRNSPTSIAERKLQKLQTLQELQTEVARRKQAIRDARARRYQLDPSAWVSERLQEFFWSKQDEIARSVRDHRRTAIRSAHGVGKSHCMSRIAGWWLDTHPAGKAFVVTTAPTAKQVEAVLWRYINQMGNRAASLGEPLPGRILTTEWKLGNELIAFGRKPADHDEQGFQGIHADFVLVILDEASGIPEQLWLAANALATNDESRIVAIGNPADPISHFAKVSRPGSGWHAIKISAFDSPNFTGEEIPAALRRSLTGPVYVEEMKRDVGEDSGIYAEKVLGEFPEDSVDQIVRTTDLAACRALELPPLAEIMAARPVELGVDVAGSEAGDESVIRERRGRFACREWRFRSDDTMFVADKVLEAIHLTGATAVKVDKAGVGQGVLDKLKLDQREGRLDKNVALPDVMVGGGATDSQRYLNLRAEIWWEVGRVMAEARNVTLAEATYDEFGRWAGGMENADMTTSQLCSVKRVPNAQDRIQVEKKEEVIKRIGRSPDNADAYLLAFYTPPTTSGDYFAALLREQGMA